MGMLKYNLYDFWKLATKSPLKGDDFVAIRFYL